MPDPFYSKEKGMINTFNIHREPIETALDQPSCPFSSFFIHPSNVSPCFWFLTKNLPPEFQGSLPSIEEIEAELSRDIATVG